jgi:hypothetical protein
MPCDLLVEVVDLGIAIRMLAPFHGLDRSRETVAGLAQQRGHRPIPDAVTSRRQGGGQLACALTRPAQRRQGITVTVRIDQRLQVRQQRRILDVQRLPTTADPSDPFGSGVRVGEFAQPLLDRGARDASGARDPRHPAMAQGARFGGQQQPALALIQVRRHGAELLHQTAIVIHPLMIRFPPHRPDLKMLFLRGL